MTKDEIRTLASNLSHTVIECRRHLHANPELSFHEYQTSAFIKQQLDDAAISWKPMANTGVVAVIKGNLPSQNVIALRADMDALPIAESNDIDYRSKNA